MHLQLVSLMLVSCLYGTALGQGLRDSFKNSRYFGVFTNPDRPNETPAAYGQLLDANFNSGTDGNACKWDSLEPNQNQFNWGRCGRTAEYITY
jgi:endo-1,4-beta-xylanase